MTKKQQLDRYYHDVKFLFTQRDIVMAFLEQKFSIRLPLSSGPFSFFAWRYVFRRDLTKKQMEKECKTLGLDNLSTVEVIHALNKTREVVDMIVEDYKK